MEIRFQTCTTYTVWVCLQYQQLWALCVTFCGTPYLQTVRPLWLLINFQWKNHFRTALVQTWGKDVRLNKPESSEFLMFNYRVFFYSITCSCRFWVSFLLCGYRSICEKDWLYNIRFDEVLVRSYQWQSKSTKV